MSLLGAGYTDLYKMCEDSPYGLVDYDTTWSGRWQKKKTAVYSSKILVTSTLMMEAVYVSEMSVGTYQATRPHNPEDQYTI
jgi:hypothetical protein